METEGSASLAARLGLERVDGERFRADPGAGPGGRPRRLFGGLLAAQALLAAGRSVEHGVVHSLHGYFLRPARHGEELCYQVERTRDGYGVSARRVVAHQGGEPVFHLAASFHVEDGGIAHQAPMPAVAPPAALPAAASAPGLGPAWLREVLELRLCDAPADASRFAHRAWLRPRQPLPNGDPLLHAAALVYASDALLLAAAARGHVARGTPGRGASLDHSAWFHGEPRFDAWLLCDAVSPAAHSGRALALASFYARDGRRLATMAQEGLLRPAGS